MRRIPLRSKNGCRRCRERRRKCDEQKPVCGVCLRSGYKCLWLPSDRGAGGQKPPIKVVTESSAIVRTEQTETELIRSIPQTTVISVRSAKGFDHPATLKASATSIVGGQVEKHVLQYLFEQGHRILRYPAQRLPISINMNAFRRGYPMAVNAPRPIQVQALLCLGAAFLSNMYPKYEAVSLQYYNSTMSAFRSVLQNRDDDFPAEWICAVASILSYYQMFVFHSSQSRLSHLTGFHRLVEARIENGLPWSRGRVLLEHYLHSLSMNALFHFDVVLARKSIGDIDYLLGVLNSEIRPLGREIVGVPEKLTAAVYKLSFLNNQDTEVSPWLFELFAVTTSLQTWQPEVDMSASSAQSLLVIARLYHLACLCLSQYLWNRDMDLVDVEFTDLVRSASVLIEKSDLVAKPINSVGWPLTVLGMFACNPSHRQTLRRPLESLADRAQLQGFRSVLQFLDYIWDTEMGSNALRRPQVLAIVHI